MKHYSKSFFWSSEDDEYLNGSQLSEGYFAGIHP